MMKVYLVTPSDDGEPRTLAIVNWPVLPRKGDSVTLHGPRFSDAHEVPAFFVVDEVEWEEWTDARGNGTEGDPAVNIFLIPGPENRIAYAPFCTCANKQCQDESDRDRCGWCGDRLKGKQ